MARYTINTTAAQEAGLTFAAGRAGVTNTDYLAARVGELLAAYGRQELEAQYDLAGVRAALETADAATLARVRAQLGVA